MIKTPQFPARLRKGDLVRVISFGLSLKGVSPSQREICKRNLETLGLRVSFGKRAEDNDEFGTSSVTARIEDLNEALIDTEVKLILSGMGGMNTAQILQSINWNLLKNNPKIFCGFSDITVLVQNLL
ncbi:MAG: LD-carboxypeptidase [Candidatus Berkelbacteria bacterium]|nr:LD-carboxypeptidase [Candidatus Berkelbacteria bacterium]